MSHPEYVNWVPLPAPVTSGSGVQSYTDPTGQMWVAANGVSGGAWRRATQVLYSRAYRAAAFNVTTTATQIPFDTVSGTHGDPYGLFTAGGTFTIPVSGLWRFAGRQGITATATGQWCIIYALVAGSQVGYYAESFASSGGFNAETGDEQYITAGQVLSFMSACSTTLAATVGTTNTFAYCQYIGVGT
jgi:hypothetical protein